MLSLNKASLLPAVTSPDKPTSVQVARKILSVQLSVPPPVYGRFADGVGRRKQGRNKGSRRSPQGSPLPRRIRCSCSIHSHSSGPRLRCAGRCTTSRRRPDCSAIAARWKGSNGYCRNCGGCVAVAGFDSVKAFQGNNALRNQGHSAGRVARVSLVAIFQMIGLPL